MSLAIFMLLAQAAANAPEPVPAPPGPAAQENSTARTELNLLGKTDSASGESRRNENVQFNPIDNNALRELSGRMGTTATIVEEFRPDRNYFGVEFGNQPPSPLHVAAPKRSLVHGGLHATHNNSVFSARSFFQAGSVQPARENRYGFTFGATVWRGAFLALDGGQEKLRGSVNGNILVPRLDERTPLTSDPALRRIVERFLGAYPLIGPNRPDVNERALNLNAPQSIDTHNAAGRLDQLLGDRDRLSFRYQITAQQVDAFQLVAGQNPDTATRSHTARITWSRVLSPASNLEISTGFDRVHSLLASEPNAAGPSVTIGATIEKLGPGSGIPIDRVRNAYRQAVTWRLSSGDHAWTAGWDVARVQFNGRETSSSRGVIFFRNDFGRDALTNFLMGIPSRFSTGIGPLDRGFRSWEHQFFAGDQWKVSSHLTVNYGVRFQPALGPYEVNALTEVPFDCDCNNLAPRFGFAYRLPARWGVLRGAYGTHFGEIFPVTFQQLRWVPPSFLKVEVQAPGLVDPLRGSGLGPGARHTLFEVPSNLRTPYSHQYNFSWETPAWGTSKVQLGYAGSRSHKLLMMWHTNRAVPVAGIPQTTATINLRRPDPAHFDVRRVSNSSRGYFDAARAALVMPARRGLSLDASYWWSKALDLGGAYINTAAGDDARQGQNQSESLVSRDLKGPSYFDQAHSFLLRLAYTTPAFPLGRWDLAAVFLAKTGTPFTVVSGSDGPGIGNVDGSSGDRPNVVDPSILGRTLSNPDTSVALLPRSAFRFIGPLDDRGNLGSNTFRKGGIRNLNASLSRTWTLHAEQKLTFRAESINFLNTPQFAEPGFDLTSPSFARITNTLNDGRTFLFTLKFQF
ncbi:MAG: hypothetical protein ACRD8O_09420 [Bryobacteraceae bacterium]